MLARPWRRTSLTLLIAASGLLASTALSTEALAARVIKLEVSNETNRALVIQGTRVFSPTSHHEEGSIKVKDKMGGLPPRKTVELVAKSQFFAKGLYLTMTFADRDSSDSVTVRGALNWNLQLITKYRAFYPSLANKSYPDGVWSQLSFIATPLKPDSQEYKFIPVATSLEAKVTDLVIKDKLITAKVTIVEKERASVADAREGSSLTETAEAGKGKEKTPTTELRRTSVVEILNDGPSNGQPPLILN